MTGQGQQAQGLAKQTEQFHQPPTGNLKTKPGISLLGHKEKNMKNNDDLMSLAGMMREQFDAHGYSMDAPDRLPAGATASAWHDDSPHQKSVIR